MEKREFPKDNWYIKITDENREWLNYWRINIVKYSNYECPLEYLYMSYRGEGGQWGGVEISTEEFKQNVYNNESVEPQEDYSYLIKFVERIKKIS